MSLISYTMLTDICYLHNVKHIRITYYSVHNSSEAYGAGSPFVDIVFADNETQSTTTFLRKFVAQSVTVRSTGVGAPR